MILLTEMHPFFQFSVKLQGITKARNGASLVHAPNFAVWCTSDFRSERLRKNKKGSISHSEMHHAGY
jgi:hypothetical protein